MKAKSIIVALIFLAALSGAAHCATYKMRGINAVAGTISGTAANTITLSRSVHIQSEDKVAKTSFDVTANMIILNFFKTAQQKNKMAGMTSVKSATMDGPVKIVYTEVDVKGNTIKTTATADNARYDGVAQMAHLIGHVKIVSENPEKFEEPAVLTGENADVNLKPNLGEDEVRFKVESTTGVSTIDVTPRAQPKKETK